MIETLRFAIGVTILLGLGVTSALYLMFGMDYTISQTVADAASECPGITFFLGFLCGHWLLPVRARK